MKRKRQISITPSTRNMLVLCVLLVIIAFNNIIWLNLDQRPPAWDQSVHFLLGLDYAAALKSFDIWKILTISNFYPPLFHLSLFPFITIIRSVDGAVLMNIVYLAIIVFSLYKLGSFLYNPSVGLLAAVVFMLFPFVQAMSRECMIDLAVTAWVCLSFYFLIRSQNFSQHRYAMAFMFSAAGGMLTKWNFVFYLSIPFIYCIVKAHPHNRRTAYLVACGIILLCSPWYLVNLPIIIRKGVRYIGIGSVEGDPRLFSLSSLLWYPLALGQQVFQPVAALIIGAVSMVFMRTLKGKWILIMWTGIPLLIHTFMSNKDIRYTLPLLPALALVLAVWFLRDGQKKKIKTIIISSVLSVLFIQSLHAAYGVPSFIRHVSFPVFGRSQVIFNADRFTTDSWKHEEIFKQCSVLFPSPRKNIRVTVVSNHPYMHGASLRCYARTRNLPFDARGYKRRLGELSPIILFKTGDRGPAFSLGKINEAAGLIQDPASSFHRTFDLSASMPLPDGSSVQIYTLALSRDMALFPREISLNLNEVRYRNFHIAGVTIDAVRNTDKAGYFKRIHLSSDVLGYKGIELHDLAINFENVAIDIPALIDRQELFFLDCDTVKLSARLKEDSLNNYLIKKAPWLNDCAVLMKDDEIRLDAHAYKIPISLRISLGIESSSRVLWTRLHHVRIMNIPVPSFLYAALTNRRFSLNAGRELQFDLALKQIVITEGSVIIQ